MAGNAHLDTRTEAAPDSAPSQFLSASAAQHAAYRRVMRGLEQTLEPAAQEQFVRRFLARLFQDAAPLAGQEVAVVHAVLAAPASDGLALVAASLLAIEAGLWAEAAALAERAYAKDQHETFAQRLLLAAQERSANLRLSIDHWLVDRFCENPFTDAEVIGNRDLYTCCAAWLPARAGSLDGSTSAEGIWNAPRIAELRRSVLDGDFSYCSRLSCPKIAARKLPRRTEVADPVLRNAIVHRQTTGIPLPRRVLLSYDTSCNLSCPSCRSALIQKSQAEVSRLDAFYADSIAPLLAGASAIKITGSGDPFGSRHFRRVLGKLASVPPETVGGPRLQLHTNGVLFDRRAWQELSLEGHVQSVWVSVDATEPDTYAELRRDGDFDRLWRNLAFLGDLRRAGRIGSLRLDFVVQLANFRQMPDLIDRASEIGADGVHFLMLRNWGTFTEQEFSDRAIANPGHPRHGELLDVLSDPWFEQPGVDLGNLAPLRRASVSPVVDETARPNHLPPVLLVLSPDRNATIPFRHHLAGRTDTMILGNAFGPAGIDDAPAALVAEFASLTGYTLLGPKDDRLVRHIRRHPNDTLLQLRKIAAQQDCKALILNLCPDHISSEVLVDDILPDPMVRPLICLPAPMQAPLRHDAGGDKPETGIAPWHSTITSGLKALNRPALVLNLADSPQEPKVIHDVVCQLLPELPFEPDPKAMDDSLSNLRTDPTSPL